KTCSLLGFFVIWHLITLTDWFTPVLLPSPLAVLAALWNMLVDGVLVSNITASLVRVCYGFILATCIGVPLGILTGWNRHFHNIVEPIVELFRPIPALAMLPLAILWFGIGEASKLFILTYGAFFPIFI